jgi:hypothetical protein
MLRIKAHNRGRRHSDNVDRLMRVRSERETLARESARIERINSTRQTLLLAVVATRLRAAHGSTDAARTSWAVESDAALNQLESSALKAALWRPAAAHVAKHHILRAVSDAWLVVKLIINVAHVWP